MEKKVTVIPASLKKFTAEPIATVKKRRTAGYARVSTDREEQATSYEAQMKYYKEYIEGRNDLEFVGMYSDEGISATSTAHRDGFNQMVEDALAGKIDLIITKSVSRFARNTVDSLTTVRKLKEKGIEIYFEKENIWTLDSKGELLITIMSSLAQEESRSISENTTWGKRKRFADGVVTFPCANLMGYEKDPEGGVRINQKEAEVVRQIYKWFLEGYTPTAIAGKLTNFKIPTPMGKQVWQPSTVKSILKNEKYKGDALLQKYFTVDFLTKKQKRNEGELPQYYVEGCHEGIIDPATFDLVQAEFERRKSGQNGRYSGVNIFSSKIRCGACGAWYGSKVWHSNDKYRKVIYHCNRKFDGEHNCSTPTLDEDEIKQLFIKAVNKLLKDKEELIENAELMKRMICETTALEKERDDLLMEMNVLAGMVKDSIGKKTAKEQSKADEFMGRYEAKKGRHTDVCKLIEERQSKATQFDNFIATLKEMRGFCNKFDEGLWCGLLEYATAYSKDDVRFTFRGGVEIRV